MWWGMYHLHVEDRGQLVGDSSLLPPCGDEGIKLRSKALEPIPLPIEPPCWASDFTF